MRVVFASQVTACPNNWVSRQRRVSNSDPFMGNRRYTGMLISP